jgi:hypothetical protein
MIRFLAGVAFGWAMARDPPTSDDIQDALQRLIKLVEKILPKDQP